MTVRVQLEAAGEVLAYIEASDGYSPDLVDDLTRRAIDTFREAVAAYDARPSCPPHSTESSEDDEA